VPASETRVPLISVVQLHKALGGAD